MDQTKIQLIRKNAEEMLSNIKSNDELPQDIILEYEWLKDAPDKPKIKDKKLIYPSTSNNIRFLLNNHEKYKGKLKYDVFYNREMYDGQKAKHNVLKSKILSDIESTMPMHNAKPIIDDALNLIFDDKENQTNCVEEYFKTIEWDGIPRIETVFIDTFKVEDTPLHREMSKKWFLSGIARAIKPGTHIEGMIVLKGEQGNGKTTFCERIPCGFGYTANINMNNHKDCVEKLSENWIVNIDDLQSFTRTEIAEIKQFLTEDEDTVRLSYRRDPEKLKRHSIFIGSTNENFFLKDYTGSYERRFWVMESHVTEPTKYLDRNPPEQIWAEAYKIYMDTNGDVELNISDKALIEEMKKEQQNFKTSNDDEVLETFKDMLEGNYDTNMRGEFNCERDFIDQTKLGSIDNSDSKRYHKINKIPIAWIKSALSKERKTQYLLAKVADDWEVKVAGYGKNETKRCFVRKKPITFGNVDTNDTSFFD